MDLTALPALGAALTGIRNMYDMMKESGNTAASDELWEINGKLLAVRGETVKLQEENLALKQEIKELKEQLRFKGGLKPFENMYWLVEDGTFVDGPFCTYCFDKNHELIRLHRTGEGWWYSKEVFHFNCLIHDSQIMLAKDKYPLEPISEREAGAKS